MKKLTLHPIKRVDGSINLPGSKSISNRALLLAALANGETRLENLLVSDDTQRMLEALTTLGITLKSGPHPMEVSLEGGNGPFRSAGAELNLGNAGTAMRPLCAALCLGQGEFTLTGIARMCERPIGDLVDALRQADAHIEYSKNEGYPPLSINAQGLRGGTVSIRGNISSQYLTALLLASPYTIEPMIIRVEGELVSKPYIDITLDLMQKFGVTVTNDRYQTFSTPNDRGYTSPGTHFIEGDASSASYFLSAGAISGGRVRVTGAGSDSIQGDIGHARVLEEMGANVTWGPNWIETSPGARLKGIDRDCSDIPDAAMTIASTALFAQGPTTLRNIYNWRVKETDRLAAMAKELRKVGAIIDEGHDYIRIDPPETIQPAEIETYDDHRMAMAMSLAALGNAPITILDPNCVAKTFPDYFEKLASISEC